MHSGDPDRALAAALDYNNRLAAAARAGAGQPPAPAAGQPAAGTPADGTTPAAPPAPPATAAPPAAPPPAAITEEQYYERLSADLTAALQGDRECAAWVGEYNTNKTKLEALGKPLTEGGQGDIAKTERAILAAQAKIAVAEELGDDGLKEQAQTALRNLESDLRIQRMDARDLQARQRDLDTSYKERYQDYRGQIEGELQTQQQQAASDARISRGAEEFQPVWDRAVTSQAVAANIPEALRGDFAMMAAQEASLYIDQNGYIKDVDGWLKAAAGRYTQRLDTYHRERSAEYARAATERANPSPVAPPGQVPPPTAEAPNPQRAAANPLAAVYANTRARLEANRRTA